MSVDINIKFSADERLLDAVEYMGGWFQALYLELQKHPVALPVKTEQAEKPPEPAQEPVQKQDANTSTPAPQKAPEAKAEAAPAEKPKAEAPENPEKELRTKAKQIAGNAARSGKADGVKELIGKYGVKKLSDIPTEKLADFIEEVQKIA